MSITIFVFDGSSYEDQEPVDEQVEQEYWVYRNYVLLWINYHVHE